MSQLRSEMAKADDFSSTNVQWREDEADLVKLMALYLSGKTSSSEVLIIQAVPASQMQVVARLAFGNNNFAPCEMYVADDRLVVIGNSYSPYRVPYPQENELSIMPPIYLINILPK